jgi:hypothetical protein
VPSSRFDLSNTGICGAIPFSNALDCVGVSGCEAHVGRRREEDAKGKDRLDRSDMASRSHVSGPCTPFTVIAAHRAGVRRPAACRCTQATLPGKAHDLPVCAIARPRRRENGSSDLKQPRPGVILEYLGVAHIAVNRRSSMTPPISSGSQTYRADRRRDPASINTVSGKHCANTESETAPAGI